MKVLYAIQGTGNGHLSRARDIIPLLMKKCELSLMVSGIQADIALPYKLDFQLNGLSFIFGKKGGVDLFSTVLRSNTPKLINDIRTLPVQQFDLVINDFEPVSAWASKFKKVPCISLSHQCAVLSPNAPKPKKSDFIGKLVLTQYAPTSAQYGFHFDRYDKHIFTPVIRSSIRNAQSSTKGHYTVYLPAYSDDLMIEYLSKIDVRWHIFSKHTTKSYEVGNAFIKPVNNDQFVESMLAAEGVLCGAGFETPAEALFLNKKLMVIPMKSQYEQQCNAASLEQMGVPVISSLNNKTIQLVAEWVNHHEPIEVDYPDETEHIIDLVLGNHAISKRYESKP